MPIIQPSFNPGMSSINNSSSSSIVAFGMASDTHFNSSESPNLRSILILPPKLVSFMRGAEGSEKSKQLDLSHTLKSCITFLSQDGQRGAMLHGVNTQAPVIFHCHPGDTMLMLAKDSHCIELSFGWFCSLFPLSHSWSRFAKAEAADTCPCKPSRSVIAYLIYTYRHNPFNFIANIMSYFSFAFQLKSIAFIGMMFSR
uniref:Uncharacterized protein n=1 Tax=Glossina palpalis gambiensis TaxID=67801 RepID=A0A1B0ASF2_9MUSC